MQKKKKKINFGIKVLIVFLIIVILECCFQVFVKSKENTKIANREENNEKEEKVEEIIIPEDITITLTAIGDIMCHNSNYNDAYDSAVGGYDFSYVFSDIKDYVQNADIAVGNLETTFAGAERGYSNYPTFNTPEALAGNLREMGIDLLSTANNHSLDKGYSGLESTLSFLEQEGIAHTGTYTSQESQGTPVIQNVNGINVAFLSFTYGTNGIPVPSGKEYCIDLINDEYIINKLNLAKAQSPDVICVFMHWGVEYRLTPTEEQERLADLLFQNGVDIILGSHPHVLEKMEKRTVTLEDGTIKDGFVIYSLGNFMSGQVKENTKNSIILNLTITKHGEDGRITIDHANYTPIYMYKRASGIKRYKILDIAKTISEYESGQSVVTQAEYNTLKKEYDKIISTVGNSF